MWQEKKRVTGIALMMLISIILSNTACAALALRNGNAIPINGDPVMIRGEAYAPAEEILLLCGYTCRERNQSFISYYNNKLKTELRFDLEALQVDKGGFLFDLGTNYDMRDGELYVESGLMGMLVNKRVNVTSGSVLLQELEIKPYDWINQSAGLVAHAGGGIGQFTYTNSYEAIVENYNKGHRVFELDLRMTSDGYLAGLHDWNKGIPLSRKAFKKTKARDYFTPVDFDDIAAMMTLNRDMYVVTDTKSYENTPEEITAQFKSLVAAAERHDRDILKRVIVQIYNQEMYDVIKPFQFANIGYTLYASRDTEEEVIDFVKRCNIKVVIMAPGKLNEAYVRKLKENGAYVYVHTINDVAEAEGFRDIGVWGIYTDFLTPGDLPRDSF